MDMERSSMSSREGSPLKSNGAYTSRINSTDAGQRELHVVQQTAAAVSSDDERVENHCLTEEDTPREINQERTISEGGQNEIQTQLQEQVTPPSSSEPQTPHNGMFGDRHRPNGSAAGGGETHHEDNELAITGDTSTGHRSKGALTCMTLTRITGLVVLAIVIAGIFSVPIVLFALKTNKDRVSGTLMKNLYITYAISMLTLYHIMYNLYRALQQLNALLRCTMVKYASQH